jgi:hypothetical protein
VTAKLDLRLALPKLSNLEVALDTEGSGHHPDDGARVSVVSLAWWDDPTDWRVEADVTSLAIPFDQGLREGKPEWVGQASLFEEEDPNLDVEQWQYLLQWLQRQNLTMNPAVFDCLMVQAGVRMGNADPQWRGVDLMPRVDWDTAIGSKELWPTKLVALKDVSVREQLLRGTRTAERMGGWRLGLEAADQATIKAHLERIKPRGVKGSARTSGRWDLGDWSAMGSYAALDAELTLRLKRRQLVLLEQAQTGEHGIQMRNARRWIPRELDKMRSLYAMMVRGVEFDVSRCLDAAATIRRTRDEVAKQLPFGHGRPTLDQARVYWFGNGDDPNKILPYAMTAGGVKGKPKPKLDAEIVDRMVQDRIPYAADFQMWTKLDNALSKWYEAYPNMCGPDGRLRTVYRQTQVRSGRTSVERINTQAIPNDYQLETRLPPGVPTVKSCVIAKAGYRLFGLDAAQAELRVSARWARCERMLELIRSGADLHGTTAREIFKADRGHPEWDRMRQVSKRANFGLIFDIGPVTFQADLSKQLGLQWDIDRCKKVVYAWRDLYPEFRRSVYRAMNSAQRNQHVKLLNGRLSWFGPNDLRVDPDCHKAFNRFVQGSLAEWGAEWMIEIERRWPGLLVLWVHDAAYLEVPLGRESVVDQIAAGGKALFEQMFDVIGGIDVHDYTGGLVAA